MYEFLLNFHNTLRWLLLPLLLAVIAFSWMGVAGKRSYAKSDKTLGGILVGMAHLQLILGLILLFVSPVVQTALQDFGAAMKDAPVRKVVLEHPLIGLIGVALIQIGRTRSKNASGDMKKHKAVAVFTTIALVLILSRIPHWNF